MANLITNGSFETDVNSWTAYQSTKTRDTTQFHSGVASMKFVASSASAPGGYSNVMTLVKGTQYRWSLWMKGTGTVRVGFFVSAYVAGTTVDCVLDSTTWKQFQFDSIPNVTAAYLYIGGTTVATGGTYWVDDVNVDVTPFAPLGAGSLIRSGAKKTLTDSLLRASAKKTLSISMLRSGAKKTVT